MLKRKILAIILMLISAVGFTSAQQKMPSESCHFHLVNNLGLLEGQTGSSFQLQTILGVQNKSWFGGVGVGLDFYRYRTIPLFIDIRKELGRTSNKLFLYADLGINFAWISDNEKSPYLVEDQFSNGFYSDLGLGYKLRAGKNSNFLVSLGYSFKKLTETYRSQIYIYTDQPQSDQFEKMIYRLNRLSIKLGWEF